jgi:transcription elongation factor GreB
MSKAFTKEDDDAPEIEEPDEPSPLPAGAKNYITPQGFATLHDELKQLRRVERPKVLEVVSKAADNGDRSENSDYLYGKKRLREIDRQTRFILKRLEAAEIVNPANQKNRSQVFFGASVTYVEEDDTEHTIRIVGVDEAELERGEVSWITPIARALMNAEKGDVVELRTPGGTRAIEVIGITYSNI